MSTPTTRRAEPVTIDDLQQHFGLIDRPDPAAFPEWQQDLPPLTDNDRSRLDDAQTHYLHLSKRPMLEAMVKMVILSPWLELAGFYDIPFYAQSEKSINISTQDDHLTIRGKIDVLVTQDQFWILVNEEPRRERTGYQNLETRACQLFHLELNRSHKRLNCSP
jgi:hypothetical protein